MKEDDFPGVKPNFPVFPYFFPGDLKFPAFSRFTRFSGKVATLSKCIYQKFKK